MFPTGVLGDTDFLPDGRGCLVSEGATVSIFHGRIDVHHERSEREVDTFEPVFGRGRGFVL
jgi:hypothetical protein